jgi:hypothetical protein
MLSRQARGHVSWPKPWPKHCAKRPANRQLTPKVCSRSHEPGEVTERSRRNRCLFRLNEPRKADSSTAARRREAPSPGHPDDPLKCQVLRTRRPTGLDTATVTRSGRRRQASGQWRAVSRICFSVAKLSSTPFLTARRASSGRRAARPVESTTALRCTTGLVVLGEEPIPVAERCRACRRSDRELAWPLSRHDLEFADCAAGRKRPLHQVARGHARVARGRLAYGLDRRSLIASRGSSC